MGDTAMWDLCERACEPYCTHLTPLAGIAVALRDISIDRSGVQQVFLRQGGRCDITGTDAGGVVSMQQPACGEHPL